MDGSVRTIGAGCATVGICFAVSSLSWQWLLVGFAVAAFVFAFWNFCAQSKQEAPRSPRAQVHGFERRRRSADVYEMPAGMRFAGDHQGNVN